MIHSLPFPSLLNNFPLLHKHLFCPSDLLAHKQLSPNDRHTAHGRSRALWGCHLALCLGLWLGIPTRSHDLAPLLPTGLMPHHCTPAQPTDAVPPSAVHSSFFFGAIIAKNALYDGKEQLATKQNQLLSHKADKIRSCFKGLHYSLLKNL